MYTEIPFFHDVVGEWIFSDWSNEEKYFCDINEKFMLWNCKRVSTRNPSVAVGINLMLYGNRINEVKRGLVICIQPIWFVASISINWIQTQYNLYNNINTRLHFPWKLCSHIFIIPSYCYVYVHQNQTESDP